MIQTSAEEFHGSKAKVGLGLAATGWEPDQVDQFPIVVLVVHCGG